MTIFANKIRNKEGSESLFRYLLPTVEDSTKQRCTLLINPNQTQIKQFASSSPPYAYDYIALPSPAMRRYGWIFPASKSIDICDYVIPSWRNRPWKRLAKFALRLLVKSPLRRALMDRILIASHTQGALQRLAMEVTKVGEPKISLIAGSAGPEQKIHGIIYDDRGVAVAHFKIAHGPFADALLKNEINMLTVLENLKGSPDLLDYGKIFDRVYLIEHHLFNNRASNELNLSHVSFLVELVSNQKIRVLESSLWNYLLYDKLSLPPKFHCYELMLISTIKWLKTFFKEISLQKTIIHGDFVPWNTINNEKGLSVLDWEHSFIDGLPLFDIIHWQFQTAFLLYNKSCKEAVDGLLREMSGFPVSKYMKESSLDFSLIIPLLILYICHRICRTAIINSSFGFDPDGRTSNFRNWFASLDFLRKLYVQ